MGRRLRTKKGAQQEQARETAISKAILAQVAVGGLSLAGASAYAAVTEGAATGTNATAIGKDSLAEVTDGVAIGTGASANLDWAPMHPRRVLSRSAAMPKPLAPARLSARARARARTASQSAQTRARHCRASRSVRTHARSTRRLSPSATALRLVRPSRLPSVRTATRAPPVPLRWAATRLPIVRTPSRWVTR